MDFPEGINKVVILKNDRNSSFFLFVIERAG